MESDRNVEVGLTSGQPIRLEKRLRSLEVHTFATQKKAAISSADFKS